MSALMYSTEKNLPLVKRGKVRDVFATYSDKFLAIVACDRIYAFNLVLPMPIPDKGVILTKMSNFWFKKTAHIIANHLVSPDPALYEWFTKEMKGRTVCVKKAVPLPVEAIVRGYLTGSVLKDYQKTGAVCGVRLPKGLKESSKLPEPIFTPSIKAAAGADNKKIAFKKTVDLIGEDLARKVRDISLRLYSFASNYARSRGIIIADTKFEFGLVDGELILIDELLTPDTSRFWPAENYKPGLPQLSFDKQYARNHLEEVRWNRRPPAPRLPIHLVSKTKEKYLDALRLLTD